MLDGLLRFHFGSKNTDKISIIFEDLLKNSVFFRTEVNQEGLSL